MWVLTWTLALWIFYTENRETQAALKVATHAELFYFVINSSSSVISQKEPSFIHTYSNTQVAKGD